MKNATKCPYTETTHTNGKNNIVLIGRILFIYMCLQRRSTVGTVLPLCNVAAVAAAAAVAGAAEGGGVAVELA